jgi:hypothetical protein
MIMRLPIGRFGFLFMLLVLSGCKGMFGSQGLPPDPLFANRKPAESKSSAGPPVDTPYAEPTPPAGEW